MIPAGAGLQRMAVEGGLEPFFCVEIPPLMGVMTALVLTFNLGLGLAYVKGTALKDAMRDFQEVVVKTITYVILPVLPVYIFGIFLDITYSGKVLAVLATFIKIIGVIFALHIFVLLFQYTVAGAVTRRNPLRLLWRMMPAYFTALGTQSSAAPIPVKLERTRANGVRPEVAGFVAPLCATIHMIGSMLKIVACALALMIALYIAMDNLGTACNVTGDGAIALVIDRLFAPGKWRNSKEVFSDVSEKLS